MLLGPGALAVAQHCAVGLPAGLAQISIDQKAGGGLIEFDAGGGLPCRLPQRRQRPGALALGLVLQLREPGRQRRLVGFGGGGQRFPFLLLLKRLAQLGLRSGELVGRLAFGALKGGQRIAQPLQLFGQLRIPGRRRLGRLKRPAAELRIAKGAVKPHPQLPGHPQDLQSSAVVTLQVVRGEIALAAQAMKQLGHLPLQHPVALQAPQQLLLRFLLPQLHAKA